MFPLQFGRFTPRDPGRLLFACAILLALTLAAPAGAQAPGDQQLPLEVPAAAAPAHFAVVDGAATIEREGQSQPATANAPFVPGDRLRTTTARVEVLFPDGTALDVDQYTALDLQSPTLIRLVSGRLLLVVAGAGNPASATRYQIDTPVASAQTDGAGEYRVAVLNGRNGLETELAVLRGSASLATEHGAMPVRAGERSVARDTETPSFPQAFNSARFDAFDRWAAARRDERTGALSARYLPQDLQMYGGAFDRSGSWQYASPYGHVWYPTVGADWRPYYDGYWAPYQPWGWTWIGSDYWAWPTHHFGRWGFARSRWFWIPGRTWSPAWVAWAGAPGFVSWCPLGFDQRPVFAFSLGFASRWAGWTVVPRHSFGVLARVDRVAVAPHLVPASAQFVAQRAAPVAVPRAAQVHNVVMPPAAAGTAVPRADAGHLRPRGNTGVQSSVGTRDAGAIARSPVSRSPIVTAPSTSHEFKQPLPDGFRSSGYAVPRGSATPVAPGRTAPANAAPLQRAADPRSYGQVPRAAYPIAPRRETPQPQAIPQPQGVPQPQVIRQPQGVPQPQAVPRWTPPTNATPAERVYQPPRSYQSPHAYQPPPVHVDHPSTPPPARADHPNMPPPVRADHPNTPPPQMPMAVPRTAPGPSTPHSGGAPPAAHSSGPSGSQAGSSDRSSSGGGHRRP